MRQRHKCCLFLLMCVCLFALSNAKQPNFVRTTVYPQGLYARSEQFVHEPITTTSFYDGFGRNIQTTTKINALPQYSIVSGSYYDQQGREWRTVNPFPASVSEFAFTEDLLRGTSNGITDGADWYYGPNGPGGPEMNANGYAFAEKAYYDDPLGRIKEIGYPGKEYSRHVKNPDVTSDEGGHPIKYWYMGSIPGRDPFDVNGFVKGSPFDESSPLNGVSFDNAKSSMLPTKIVCMGKTTVPNPPTEGELWIHVSWGWVDAYTTGSWRYAHRIELDEQYIDLDHNTICKNSADGWIARDPQAGELAYVELGEKVYKFVSPEAGWVEFEGSPYQLQVSIGPNEKDVRQSLYDGSGKLRKLLTWSGAGSPIVASYEYDVAGNVKLQKGPYTDTRFCYNTQGSLISKTSVDAGKKEYYYDNEGKLLASVSSRQKAATPKNYLHYHYDQSGRIIQITEDEGEPNESPSQLGKSSVRKEIYYDGLSNIPKALKSEIEVLAGLIETQNCVGRIAVQVAYDQDGTNRVIDIYSYYNDGQIQSLHKLVPGIDVQKYEFQYDNTGKMVSEKYWNGQVLIDFKNFDYDTEGRLLGILDCKKGTCSELARYTYDQIGNLKQKQFNPGANNGSLSLSEYKYNSRYWLTSILSKGVDGKTLFSESIEHGNETEFGGNIEKSSYTYGGIDGGTNSATFNYQYDNVSRLIGVNALIGQGSDWGGKSESEITEDFAYDAGGRFLQKSAGSNNRYYQYHCKIEDLLDDDGDKIGENRFETNRVKWTADEPPPGAQVAGQYVYDADGNMILDKNKKMAIVYDWQNLPVEFVFFNNMDNAIITDEYGTFNGDIVAAVIGPDNNGDPEAQILSRVKMIYDANGNRVYKIVE